MGILIVTFVAMGLFIVLMAVGVLFGRAPLKGSCGGLNKIGIDGKCEICGRDREEMERECSESRSKILALTYNPLSDREKQDNKG